MMDKVRTTSNTDRNKPSSETCRMSGGVNSRFPLLVLLYKVVQLQTRHGHQQTEVEAKRNTVCVVQHLGGTGIDF